MRCSLPPPKIPRKNSIQETKREYSVVFVRTLTFYVAATQIFPLAGSGLSVYILEISGAVVFGRFSFDGGPRLK
jgi:hypothetical protein